ncbi:MAG: hypothetical protein WCJ87_13080, partial [Burkholderiales bacterium]
MSTLSKVLTGVFVAALWVPVPQAQALLVDRGSGMLYDTALNVTWLQDANYAKTSGYCNAPGNCSNAQGRVGAMTWTQANAWANNLNYGGYSSGWRLARNTPVNGTQSGWNYTWSASGSTDVGYNITSNSELGYMYYVNLELKGFFNPDKSERSDYGIFGNGTFGGQNNVGLVRNLQSYVYWSGTAYPPSPDRDAWGFHTSIGFQDSDPQRSGYFAWAVRDGDVTVAAVPVP